MKILFVNVVCGIKSTGRICTDLAEDLIKQGHDVKIAYGRGTVPEKYKDISVRIGTDRDVLFHALGSKLFDKCGYGSKRATKKFIRWAEEFNPDVLWLHNIHDHYINIFYLFDWIKTRPDMKVKWTQHDCWAFTGGCFHFTRSGCEQWCSVCRHCPSKKLVSNPPLIRSPKTNFINKKACFSGIKNMELISPSEWLASQIKKSFLKNYPIIVCNNKVDTSVFKPTESDFREIMLLKDKHIILGVASAWSKAKGFDDFIQLSKKLRDDEKIILVGLSKNQKKRLPRDIIGLERTDSPTDLAKIYTAADVFVNLTYEDTYPTVNLEAKACGTPCVTYRTGGSTESVPSKNVVKAGDLDALLRVVRGLYKN